MRPRPLLVTLTAVIAVAAGCGSSGAGSNAPNGVQSKSGDQIVAAAVTATGRQRSFHFVETTGAAGASVSLVSDVGTSSGEERVTIHDGIKDGHLTLRLVARTAYLQGDALGLEDFTGLSAKLAGDFAGKWISVPSTNAGFSDLAGSLAVKTASTQLVKLPGTLTRGKTSTELGHPAVAVDAAQTTSSGSLKLTMYVATTGAALPILVEGTTQATGSTAHSVSGKFSDWGETFHLSAPSASVPLATLQALAG